MHIAKPEGSTTGRGPSYTLWNLSRYSEIVDNPNVGHIFLPFNEFNNYKQEDYAIYNSGGTVNQIDGDGGKIRITTGATANTHYTFLRSGGGDEAGNSTTVYNVTPEAGCRISVEARVALASWATVPDFFFGLAETGIVSTDLDGGLGLVAGDEFVAFENSKGSGVSTSIYAGSSDGTTLSRYATAVHTMSTTLVKLGFIIEGLNKVRFFVDGVEQKAAQSAKVPAGPLGLLLGMVSEGAAATFDVDWIYGVKSLRNP